MVRTPHADRFVLLKGDETMALAGETDISGIGEAAEEREVDCDDEVDEIAAEAAEIGEDEIERASREGRYAEARASAFWWPLPFRWKSKEATLLQLTSHSSHLNVEDRTDEERAEDIVEEGKEVSGRWEYAVSDLLFETTWERDSKKEMQNKKANRTDSHKKAAPKRASNRKQ